MAYTYAASDVVGPAIDLYPTKYSSLGWIAAPGSSANAMDGTSANHNTGTRTFSWAGITTFSDFTAAGDGSPLPIELLNLSASVTPSEEVKINWITASETNNSHFIIERSINAKDYELVGRVEGQGSSSFMHSYDLMDVRPYSGVSYYRLTQVDFNGESEKFEPVAVNLIKSASVVNLYPNPATNSTTAEVTSLNNQTADFQIIDMEGRIVYRFSSNLAKGANKVSISTVDIPQGNYMLSISTNKGERQHLPLLIIK